jgi:putative ABC transport system permease protein
LGLKHVLRRLIRSPMFTGITVMTLGLGIGANGAIFSVIEGVLLKPLPYWHADELIAVNHAAPGVNIKNLGIAAFLYFTYRDESRTFQDIGMWASETSTVTGLAEPEEVPGIEVTDRVLPALGVQPAYGRLFSRRDDSPESPETMILTYGYWRAKFGSDPSVIGRRLVLDGRPREIIGVLPEPFRFLDLRPAVILPLRLDPNRVVLGQFNFTGMARLKPGMTIAQTNIDVARMIPLALQRYPPFPGATIKMFEEARLGPLVQPLKQSVVGDIGTVLWVLMGTVGIVMLIACANVANLLLVRVEGRQHELAIRAALGADRGHIAREVLLESVTLGVIGGVVGLGLAYCALRLLTAIAPANLPRLEQISIDGTVLLFTLVISLVAGALFGAIPALKYAGPQLGKAMRSEGRALTQSRERHRARSGLVVVQVALALVLLIGSGLMIRTFQALKHVQPGFTRPGEVQTLSISIPAAAVRDPVAVVRMEQNIVDRIAAIPGVSSVALTTIFPMDGGGWHDALFAEDHAYTDRQLPPIREFKFVSPGLLKTMGNTLVVGRDFTWADVYGKRPVAMVSENLARELWRDPQAAIGKRIRENLRASWREIVGVVGDERDDGLDKKAPAMAIWPILMDNFSGEETWVRRTLTYVVRSSRAGSRGLMTEISHAVWSVNPNLPVSNVRTLQEIYDKSLARTSFTFVMLAIAGAMALLLGVAGIYGVISYSVVQRTREIGIRIALGAQSEEVTRMFVGHGARLSAIGVVCGIITALAFTRLLSSMLFDVGPFDPLTYGGVSLGLTAAAVLASYIPALRATTVDPIQALRAE